MSIDAVVLFYRVWHSVVLKPAEDDFQLTDAIWNKLVLYRFPLDLVCYIAEKSWNTRGYSKGKKNKANNLCLLINVDWYCCSIFTVFHLLASLRLTDDVRELTGVVWKKYTSFFYKNLFL